MSIWRVAGYTFWFWKKTQRTSFRSKYAEVDVAIQNDDDDDVKPEGDTIIMSFVEMESDWREHWNIACTKFKTMNRAVSGYAFSLCHQ